MMVLSACDKSGSFGASSSSADLGSVDLGAAPSSTYVASSSVPMGAFTVRLKNLDGSVRTTDNTTTITLSVASGSSTLGGTLTQTVVAGIATFTDITYTKAESLQIRATENSSGKSLSVTSTISVGPGAAATLTQVSGAGQSSTVGYTLAIPFGVQVQDAFGNNLSASTVNWAVMAGGGALSSSTSITDSSGIATSTLTLGLTAGSQTVKATANGSSITINLSAIATSISLSIAAVSVGAGNSAAFTVTLNHASTVSTQVNYATTDGTAVAGTDYIAASGTLTIAAGATAGTVTVSTVVTVTPGTKTFSVNLSAPVNAVIGTSQGTATVTDPGSSFSFMGSIPSGFSFSRASVGSYYNSSGVLATASANSPRYDYHPYTGQLRGLLIEGQSTNGIKYSQDFSNAAWHTTNLSVTPNTAATTAPDGTNTAALVSEDTATTAKSIYQYSVPVTAGKFFTFSVYAKMPSTNGHRWLKLIVLDGTTSTDNIYALFDLATGSVTIFNQNFVSTSGYGSKSALAMAERLPNSWWRLRLTGLQSQTPDTPSSTVTARIGFTSTATGGDTYLGTGAGAYFWGAQLESNTLAPSSYIATTSASVTRSADILTSTTVQTVLSGTSWTAILRFMRPFIEHDGDSLVTSPMAYFCGSNCLSNNVSLFYTPASRLISASSVVSGATQTTASSKSYINDSVSGSEVSAANNGIYLMPNTQYDVALSYSNGGLTTYLNGESPGAVASFTVPALTSIVLGDNGSGSAGMSYHLQGFYLKNFAMSGTQALALENAADGAYANSRSTIPGARAPQGLGNYNNPSNTVGSYCNESAMEGLESWLNTSIGSWLTVDGGFAGTTWTGTTGFTTGGGSVLAGCYPNRTVVLYVPMFPLNDTASVDLPAIAAGTYDADFTAMAARIAGYSQFNSAIIRLGWEFNLAGYQGTSGTPWSTSDHTAIVPSQYIAAFQHIVTLFRAQSSGFKFDWNAYAGLGGGDSTGYQASDYYPGDAYVDYIGLDFYENMFVIANNIKRWAMEIYQPSGLLMHRDFALLHGKPISFPEWGTGNWYNGTFNAGDNPFYIQQMYYWIKNNNVKYFSYWNKRSSTDVDSQVYSADVNSQPSTNFPNMQGEFRLRWGH